MVIPSIESVESKEQAQDLAIQWQSWQGERSLSWGELASWSDFFWKIGQKFDLTEEFRENGIC